MHCAGFKPTSRPIATNIMEKHSAALRGVVGGVAVLVVVPQRISRPEVKITIISSNSNNKSRPFLPSGGTRNILQYFIVEFLK